MHMLCASSAGDACTEPVRKMQEEEVRVCFALLVAGEAEVYPLLHASRMRDFPNRPPAWDTVSNWLGEGLSAYVGRVWALCWA
jgi:hypothetical protein